MIIGISKAQLEKNMGIHTAKEICQQPSTWRKTFKQIVQMQDQIKSFVEQVTTQPVFDVVLTGAGTSEFVGNSAFSFLNGLLGYNVKSYGTTDIVATPENYLSKTKPTLLVSYGRSGNSPESLAAVEVADQVCENIFHLMITCNSNGALSKGAFTRSNCLAINLTPETHDEGFAMTSSFSNMYLATLLCFQIDKLDEIESKVEEICNKGTTLTVDDYAKVEEIVADFNFNRIVYLGSNVLKGIAQESALKLLELTAGQVTTMHDTPMGFRHGPKSIINDETLTVLYLSDDKYTRLYDFDLLKEMSAQRKGNKILVVGNKLTDEEKSLANYSYSFDSSLENAYLGLEYIMFAQLLALYKSLSLNITPDNPCPTGEVNRVVQGVIIHKY